MEKNDFLRRLEDAKRLKQESIDYDTQELKTMYEAETGKKANYIFVL